MKRPADLPGSAGLAVSAGRVDRLPGLRVAARRLRQRRLLAIKVLSWYDSFLRPRQPRGGPDEENGERVVGRLPDEHPRAAARDERGLRAGRVGRDGGGPPRLP